MHRGLSAWLVAALMLALTTAAPAQQPAPSDQAQPAPTPRKAKKPRTPPAELDDQDQLSPRR